MQFNQTGLNEDDIVQLIVNDKHIKAFLLDLQNTWRIQRSLQEDPGDAWLIGSRAIDQIIEELGKMESHLIAYREMKRMQEEEAEKNAEK